MHGLTGDLLFVGCDRIAWALCSEYRHPGDPFELVNVSDDSRAAAFYRRYRPHRSGSSRLGAGNAALRPPPEVLTSEKGNMRALKCHASRSSYLAWGQADGYTGSTSSRIHGGNEAACAMSAACHRRGGKEAKEPRQQSPAVR